MSDWFSELFGVRGGSYEWTQKQFGFHDGILSSEHTSRTFVPGSFSTLTVAELRSRAPTAEEHSSVLRAVAEDVVDLHADPKNAGDMFQVASKTVNCLTKK